MNNNFKKEVAPVLYNEYSTKILHFKKAKNELCFSLHWHERMELLIIRKGKMQLQIGEDYYIAQENAILIVYPKQIHSGICLEDIQYDVLMFDLINLKNDSLAYNKYLKPIEKGEIVFTNLIYDLSFLKLVDKIIYSSETNKSNPLQVIADIYNLFSKLYIKYQNTKREISKSIDSFTEIMDYINNNFLLNISTSTVSNKFGYNEAYFSRKFKKITGTTLMKYIQILRLEYSKNLLKNTNESITSIANKCGFSDIFYYSKCFYKHFKLTPSNYRKNNIK